MNHVYNNSQLQSGALDQLLKLDKELNNLELAYADKLKLTARSYYKVLKVALTIADLEQSITIKKSHILEAFSYRKKIVS